MTEQVCTIYLVRHGQSEHNRDGVLSGHGDAGLTDEGRQQVRETKQVLKKVHFDAAYSSVLLRAIETAEIIYGKPFPDTNKLTGLKERTWGSLEGRPQSDLDTSRIEKH